MSWQNDLRKAGIESDGRKIQLFGRGGTMGGTLLGAGTSSSKAVCDTASSNFLSFYLDNGATSGDNRGMYLRLYLTGASSGGGEALRVFTTVSDSQATCHGAHVSLSFAADKVVSGLGVALRGTVHVPSSSTTKLTGTISALQAELYGDGAASTFNTTELSFIRIVADGNAAMKNDLDDKGFLMSIQGLTAGAAHILATGLTAATVNAATTASLRIKIGTTTYYIPVATAIA